MAPVKKKYQDPIDNAIYKSAKYVAPTFKKLNFTANDITTLSNISMCITLILLLHAKYYWACLFVFLAYYFDCLDGFFARKYKQTSKFGENYDHISDIIKTLFLLIILFYINPTKFIKVIPIFIIFNIITLAYCGCGDKIRNDDILLLSYTKQLCPITDVNNKKEVSKYMNILKYFGPGMTQILTIFVIIYFSL